MVAHINLVAALAAEQAGLLLHTLVFGVDLAFADAQVCTATGADDGEADASTDIRLLGLVVIGVLQALQREVATHGGGDFVCTDLRAFEGSVSSADQADLFAGVQRCFRPGGAGALLVAGALVRIGEDAQATFSGTHAQTDANRSTAAAVFAIELLIVGRSLQANIALRSQRHFIAGLELAALNADITGVSRRAIPLRHDGEVIARRQVAALAEGLFLRLFGVGLLRPQGDADTYKLPSVGAGHAAILLRRLPRLHPRQTRLHTLQRREATVVLAFGLLGSSVSGVHRATHGAGECQGQTTGFAFGRLFAAVVVFGRQDADILPNQADVFTGNHVRAFDGEVFARPDIHAAQHAADVAGPGGFGAAGEGVFIAA
ncbi:hypothetical protein [Pseudomonas sp. 24 E 13]|nr:hypothetical protein [Pseudomonas sp. 24 E 13]